jgi:hypothetical protein
VTVSIDGVPVPNLVIAQKLLSVAQATGTTPDDPSTQTAAVAIAILDKLLFDEAVSAGHEATLADATAAANEQLAAFEQNPASNIIPTGETPAQFFLSAQTIGAYQIQLTVGTERRLILGNLDPQSDHTPALREWMQSVLGHHSVNVSGVAISSVSSLPSYLPPNL